MSARLFNPRTREDALHTANELAAAAVRQREAARDHPGRTGRILRTLAKRYDGLSRDWTAIADDFPPSSGAAPIDR